ncbi:MAG: hypothetical protein ACREDR_04745 [Blastocatellia bacterium]
MSKRIRSFMFGSVRLTARAPRNLTALLSVLVMLFALTPVTARDHKALAALIDRLSEPGGFFDSDNLISNETSYLHVMEKLNEIQVHGGVYIGVGPDQNFTYIAKIRPRMVFIIDIRRDNMLEQFVFKSLFERAHNRVQYMCLLFGKPFPKTRGWEQKTVEDLADYIDKTPSDAALFAKTLKDVAHDAKQYYPELNPGDLEVVERIQRAFYESGLDIRYSSHFRPPRSIYPSYRELLLERDLSGHRGNYLNSEDDFRFLKKLEENDLIVPVIGDVSGSHALKAIGQQVAEMKEKVSALYMSNVEFYLSREGTFEKYAENLKSLPIDDKSVIIRSYFNYYAPRHPQAVPGHFSTQLLERIGDLLKQCESGDCDSYSEIVTRNSILLQ